jgi:hypothetical protein
MIGFDCAIWLRDTRHSEAPELERVTILDRVEICTLRCLKYRSFLVATISR